MPTITRKTSSLVTEAQARQYREEGWFVLERVLSADQLELLRGFGQTAIHRADAEMDAAGVDKLDLTIADVATSSPGWPSRSRCCARSSSET